PAARRAGPFDLQRIGVVPQRRGRAAQPGSLRRWPGDDMARKKITINHPTLNDPPPSSTFVAFGDAVGVLNVVGVILHPQKGLIRGTQLGGPPNWAIFFEKVPNSDCILLVFDPLDWTTLAFSLFPLKVPRAAKGPALAAGDIIINYPAGPNPTVCNNFIAYGT